MQKKGIQIINAPEGNRDALAEHAVGMLLSLFNKIPQADRQVRNGEWNREKNRGIELMGKQVGIIGYGFMGQAFAARLQGFGCEILAFDKYKPGPFEPYVRSVPIHQLWNETDILSIHLPLTDETHHLIDVAFLNKFRKKIYLLNTSRGGILKQDALIDCLQNGQVIGAALDVLENEKLSSLTPKQQRNLQTLTKHPQILLTPHVAGWTLESYEKINQVLVEKLKAMRFH